MRPLEGVGKKEEAGEGKKGRKWQARRGQDGGYTNNKKRQVIMVWISNDLRGRSGCLVRVLGDLRVRFEHYAVVFSIFRCRFHVTFGCVLGALAWVSGTSG